MSLCGFVRVCNLALRQPSVYILISRILVSNPALRASEGAGWNGQLPLAAFIGT